MGRYRAAIVGTGAIAGAHARAVRAHDDRAELVAVVDIDPARAEAFAAEWAVPSVAKDLSDILDSVDLVHICTPPAAHAPLALESLRAGVHVLLEKPPTLSLAELDTLAAAARDSGAHLATVFQHRFGAGAERLRALVAAGELGRPLLATCETLWHRDDDYYGVPWRGRWETEGGGPTMGHGIHQFDLLLSVLGPWQQVTAVAARQARPVQTEDVSMALVTFAGGAVASVVNSVLSARQVSALRFDFERATVELSHLYGYTDDNWTFTPAPGHDALAARWAELRSDKNDGNDEDHSEENGSNDEDHSDKSGSNDGNDGDHSDEGGSDQESSHAVQLAAVLDALDAGQAPPVTVADTRQTMEFIAALYASAFTRQPIERGQIGPGHPFATRMNGTGAPWETSR